MLRGYTLFKCTSCGHKFMAPDIEYCATMFSIPQRCPECHSLRTRPARLFDGFLQDKMYASIWKEMEQAEEDSSAKK